MGQVYDNEYGGDGNYDYNNGGAEVRNPLEVEPQPESNEYTNNDIRDSLGADPNQSNDYDYGYSM